MRAIDDAKREALTPEMVCDFAQKEAEHIKNDKNSISTRGATKGKLKAEAEERIQKCETTILFSQIYERYEKDKREQKKMDFNDLIIELLVALRNDELFFILSKRGSCIFWSMSIRTRTMHRISSWLL